jgi:condensin complex subunit 1
MKKVKGSLLDKSVCIEMSSPVFCKLQKSIEHSCWSREWFALAEQAINTIYALSNRPEVLSNTIIKRQGRFETGRSCRSWSVDGALMEKAHQ